MRKLSKPVSETESRAEASSNRPAQDENRSQNAQHHRRRRRTPRRGSESDTPLQGTLFDDESLPPNKSEGVIRASDERRYSAEKGARTPNDNSSEGRRERRKALAQAHRDRSISVPAQKRGKANQKHPESPPFGARNAAAGRHLRGPDRREREFPKKNSPSSAQTPPSGLLRETARRLESLAPSTESLASLDALRTAVEETLPLSPKHRATLRKGIRTLWEELTSERERRSEEYLGTTAALSAYLRYFMPWNVFRLTSLFSNADFCLPDGAVVADIGSGPLTVPIALWASRPELREVPLTIYCMDRVERALETGLAVFETLCMRTEGRLPPWRIVPRKGSFGGPLPERAHLLTAANLLNEFFWKDKSSLGERALATARTLLSYTRENGSLLVMEPGDPRSGSLISALRAALLAEGASPLGPCPHALSCPMPGIFKHLVPPEETKISESGPNAVPPRFTLAPVAMPKKREKYPWCHLGIDTARAPAWLESLSEEAGLPKERVVLSYLWAARGAAPRTPIMPPGQTPSGREQRSRTERRILVRVISESFALSDGSSGQYACSSLGFTLVKHHRGVKGFFSGDLLEVMQPPLLQSDAKSGAVILPT